jgi:hypothetical protein
MSPPAHPPPLAQPGLLRRIPTDPQPVLDELRADHGPVVGPGAGRDPDVEPTSTEVPRPVGMVVNRPRGGVPMRVRARPGTLSGPRPAAGGGR